MLIEILTFIVVSIVIAGIIGFFSAQWAKFLDFCFDYKEIFWKFRFARVWKSSSYSVRKFMLQAMQGLDNMAELSDQQEIVRKLYTFAATKNPKILLWLCPVCLSTRISLFISLVVTAFLCIESFWFLSVPFFAVGLNYYFVRE